MHLILLLRFSLAPSVPKPVSSLRRCVKAEREILRREVLRDHMSHVTTAVQICASASCHSQ